MNASGVFTFLSRVGLRVGFAFRDRDDPARKVGQTLEGSRVRCLMGYGFFRRPLRGDPSRRSGGRILTDQLTIGQATTGDRSKGNGEAVRIIALAVVEPEDLLIEVAEQMERFHADISPLDPALEQAPEVFDGVGMHGAPHVFNGMIHDLMGILTPQSSVGHPGIGKQGGTLHDVTANFSVQAEACQRSPEIPPGTLI